MYLLGLVVGYLILNTDFKRSKIEGRYRSVYVSIKFFLVYFVVYTLLWLFLH